MLTLTTILQFFGMYPSLISFLGGVLGGEETIILLSVIAAHGYMNIWTVIIFCYLGILASDTVWYYIGKSSLFGWFVKRKGVSKAYYHLDRALDRATMGNDFQALLATKFLYGFRIITIMYLSRERMNLIKFVFYSAIVDAIWISVVSSIGWFSGKGIKFALLVSNNLIVSFALLGIVLIVFVILMGIISNKLRKWLTKKQSL